MHNNLFNWASDDREVYATLQRDTKRDIRVRQSLNFVFIAAVAYLSRDMPGLDRLAAVVAAWSGLAGLQYFIDESNRNFWMHQIDWMRATKDREGV